MSNEDKFKDEIYTAGSIRKRNRHSSADARQWFGPDPEPIKPGPSCSCLGCETVRKLEKIQNRAKKA